MGADKAAVRNRKPYVYAHFYKICCLVLLNRLCVMFYLFKRILIKLIAYPKCIGLLSEFYFNFSDKSKNSYICSKMEPIFLVIFSDRDVELWSFL